MTRCIVALFIITGLLTTWASAQRQSDSAEGTTWDFKSAVSWEGGPLANGYWPIDGGVMRISTPENRKEISIRQPHTIIPAGAQNVLQITMTATSAKTCRFYFTTGTDPVYDAAKMVEFELKPDPGPQTYNLDLSSVTTWAGQVSSLKFAFPDATPDMKIGVSLIKVLVGDKIAVPLSYTSFKLGAAPVIKIFRLGSLFSNGMVLQRQMKIPVWGHAQPGAAVSVEFKAKTATAHANADGDWSVKLDPCEAGGPYTMKVTSADQHIDLTDILVGDVWVCAGQSNMLGRPRESPIPEDQRKELLETAYPDLRYVQVRTLDSPTPVSNTSIVVPYRWSPTPADPVYSAASYYFGRELQATQKIPIGMIFIIKAGSQIEQWSSAPTLHSIYSQKEFDAICGGKKLGAGLYNGMVAPSMPYGIKGAIWYQGEANVFTPALYTAYYKALPAFIKNWRDAWGQGDFPFMIVQLPQFARGLPEAWPNIREAQLLASQQVPNVGLAVTFDTGEPDVLHPKNKYVVGHHLALAARQMVYGEKNTGTGPMYQSMKTDDQKIVVTFTQTAAGLLAKGALAGFEIRGADNQWIAATATISSPSTIDVSAPTVHEPKAVRYAWANNPTATLYNSEGLPASPFTSDAPMVNK